jgi:hypothetical protein
VFTKPRVTLYFSTRSYLHAKNNDFIYSSLNLKTLCMFQHPQYFTWPKDTLYVWTWSKYSQQHFVYFYLLKRQGQPNRKILKWTFFSLCFLNLESLCMFQHPQYMLLNLKTLCMSQHSQIFKTAFFYFYLLNRQGQPNRKILKRAFGFFRVY